ncbi:hypothetical protein LINPERHAP2_LOCUS36811, partial [Linum perenne]
QRKNTKKRKSQLLSTSYFNSKNPENKKTKRERVQKFKYSHYCSRNYKAMKERKHQARNSKLTRSHPTTTFYKIIGYHLRNHYL